MSGVAEELYKDYWVGAEGDRDKRKYYQRLYDRLKPKIKMEANWKVLDVAGGNGQLLRYLEIPHADILDISESGLAIAKKSGFNVFFWDVEQRFPMPTESYDAVLL